MDGAFSVSRWRGHSTPRVAFHEAATWDTRACESTMPWRKEIFFFFTSSIMRRSWASVRVTNKKKKKKKSHRLAIFHEWHEQKYGPNRSPSPPPFLPPPVLLPPDASLIRSKVSFHDLQLSLQRQTHPRGSCARSFMGPASITSLHFIYFLYHLSICAFIWCCHTGRIHVWSEWFLCPFA